LPMSGHGHMGGRRADHNFIRPGISRGIPCEITAYYIEGHLTYHLQKA